MNQEAAERILPLDLDCHGTHAHTLGALRAAIAGQTSREIHPCVAWPVCGTGYIALNETRRPAISMCAICRGTGERAFYAYKAVHGATKALEARAVSDHNLTAESRRELIRDCLTLEAVIVPHSYMRDRIARLRVDLERGIPLHRLLGRDL